MNKPKIHFANYHTVKATSGVSTDFRDILLMSSEYGKETEKFDTSFLLTPRHFDLKTLFCQFSDSYSKSLFLANILSNKKRKQPIKNILFIIYKVLTRMGLSRKYFAWNVYKLEKIYNTSIWYDFFENDYMHSEFSSVCQDLEMEFTKLSLDCLSRLLVNNIFTQKFHPCLLELQNKNDILFFNHPLPVFPAKGKTIIRLHDVIPLFNVSPKQANSQFGNMMYQTLKIALENNAFFVANSENSRQEVLNYFPQLEKKIEVIHCSIAEQFFQVNKKNPENIRKILNMATLINEEIPDYIFELPKENVLHGIQKFWKSSQEMQSAFQKCITQVEDYFITIGSEQLRKNHVRLLTVLHRVSLKKAKSVTLVMFGDCDISRDQWQPVLRKIREVCKFVNIFILQSIDCDMARYLLTSSTAFISYSAIEGFGKGVIEAQAAGTPVVCSSITTFKETTNGSAIIDNMNSLEKSAEILERLMEDEDYRRYYINAGKINAEKFRRCNLKEKWGAFYDKVLLK